jgi:hypothetical protein
LQNKVERKMGSDTIFFIFIGSALHGAMAKMVSDPIFML